MCPAPILADSFPSSGAIAAPDKACQHGTLTRRALVGGALATTLWPGAGRADDLREAARLATGGLGYDGASPGAVLRGEIGEPLRLTLAHALDAPTSYALQGLRVDPNPGFPGLGAAPVAPGERRALVFTPSEAGFGLYGAYGPGDLFGAVVVAEAAPPAVDLDAVVVFSGDPAAPRANGVALPLSFDAPPGGRVRLRLASAAPEGLWTLSTAESVQVVAVDGQPCEMFSPRAGALPLCPSARFDLMFDLGEAGADFALDGLPALRFVAKGERAAARPAIAALPANPRLPKTIALERALRATLRLSGRGSYAMNKVGGADWPRKPLFQAKRGQPVVLTLINDTGQAQTLRLEGHWARRLHGLDDGWDPYWRDAFYIERGATWLAAFVADNPGKWPLASASPERRAKGLATWFAVT